MTLSARVFRTWRGPEEEEEGGVDIDVVAMFCILTFSAAINSSLFHCPLPSISKSGDTSLKRVWAITHAKAIDESNAVFLGALRVEYDLRTPK